jgi:hypothetical protein
MTSYRNIYCSFYLIFLPFKPFFEKKSSLISVSLQ